LVIDMYAEDDVNSSMRAVDGHDCSLVSKLSRMKLERTVAAQHMLTRESLTPVGCG
jgi:hypothetical protein